MEVLHQITSYDKNLFVHLNKVEDFYKGLKQLELLQKKSINKFIYKFSNKKFLHTYINFSQKRINRFRIIAASCKSAS